MASGSFRPTPTWMLRRWRFGTRICGWWRTSFARSKAVLRTRPVYHSSDEAIRGHVFSSFLALMMLKELLGRIKETGDRVEWQQLQRELDGLQHVTIRNDSKAIRTTEVRGDPHKALQAAGVAPGPVVSLCEPQGTAYQPAERSLTEETVVPNAKPEVVCILSTKGCDFPVFKVGQGDALIVTDRPNLRMLRAGARSLGSVKDGFVGGAVPEPHAMDRAPPPSPHNRGQQCDSGRLPTGIPAGRKEPGETRLYA